MTTDNKFDLPYISLKFGGIKSIDFKDNEELQKFYDQIEEHTTESDIEIIKRYNGNFFIWWGQKWVTKEEAINYILDYKSND